MKQGGQQTLDTLEDAEKPWILFAPGKIPWKTLKLQPIPEKLWSETDFPCINFGLAELLHFLFLYRKGGGSMGLLVGKNSISFVVW